MKRIYIVFSLLLLIGIVEVKAQSAPKDLVFNIEVSHSQMPSITLKWKKQVGVSAYKVMRKSRNQKLFSTLATNIPLDDTVFTDINVSVGSAYEYSVQSATNPNITGYVYAGIEVPAVHQAGEILLLIDNTYQQSAAAEIETYKVDLIKEGWKVAIEYVSRTLSVVNVKQLIVNHYNQNPTGLKGIVILGHVAVPYSGNIAPDAHSDHFGAWPSDMYYGDMNLQSSNWNDVSLNVISASDLRNHNVVGDGKFDLSTKTSACEMKLFVGRVDVYNMGYISTNDAMLFKQYLQKNHVYRAGLKKFKQQGVVDDNFGFMSGEAFAQNGWRNLSSLVGSDRVKAGDYFSDMKADSYIWSYGCGGGWSTGATGVGTTNDFKTAQVQGVFTMLYGSYFGDWDSKNNFLRAPLASPSSTLVSCWGGRPNWFFHTMALGEPIGYSYLNSIDNPGTYTPRGFYADQVHQSLLGDPSLKMYMTDAPLNLMAAGIENNSKVQLNWDASPDLGTIGYYVYRSESIDGDFVLLTPNAINSTSFTDEFPIMDINGQNSVYMVKAVKLEASNTGTFYNLSPGIIVNQILLSIPLPANLLSFHGIHQSNSSNLLTWVSTEEKNLLGYELQVSENQEDFEMLGFLPALGGSLTQTYQYEDSKPFIESYYRLKMIDLDGRFSYSEIVYLKKADSSPEIICYPNPCFNELNIQYPAAESSNIVVQVIDMKGRIVQHRQFQALEGSNVFQLPDIGTLTKGIYVLNIYNETSLERQQIRISVE